MSEVEQNVEDTLTRDRAVRNLEHLMYRPFQGLLFRIHSHLLQVGLTMALFLQRRFSSESQKMMKYFNHKSGHVLETSAISNHLEGIKKTGQLSHKVRQRTSKQFTSAPTCSVKTNLSRVGSCCWMTYVGFSGGFGFFLGAF